MADEKSHFWAQGFDPSAIDDTREIIARDVHFGISQSPCRHWYDGDMFRTVIWDVFSTTLPEGERFFIRSLKNYARKVGDEKLLEEINGYAVQEAYHTREHEDYNRGLVALGYDVEEIERPARNMLSNTRKPLLCLAITCAIEHMTATYSTLALSDPHMLANSDPNYRRLWLWHALEELEHKGVALDVYAMATKDMPGWKSYLFRITVMVTFLVRFNYVMFRGMRIYAKNEGRKTGPGFWWSVFKVLFVKPGMWRRSAGYMAGYFRPGYDPHKVDDRALIKRGRTLLYNELSRTGQVSA